jgi:hypothetical protein
MITFGREGNCVGMKTLRVGIDSYERMKERTLAIARGGYISRLPTHPRSGSRPRKASQKSYPIATGLYWISSRQLLLNRSQRWLMRPVV